MNGQRSEHLDSLGTVAPEGRKQYLGDSGCKTALKALSCLTAVGLLFATVTGVIFFQADLLAWIESNVLINGPVLFLLGITDVILIVSLLIKGGCPRDEHCPHAYRSLWHQRNKARYPSR